MFKSARIQLTAWYLLSIMVISIAFSTVIYQLITHEVDRFDRIQKTRIERRMRINIDRQLERAMSQMGVAPFANPDLVAEIKYRIAVGLLLINGAISIIACGLGYMLAGRTLGPIKDMVDDQKRFITDASHELKTPITSLKAAFEVYLRDPHRSKKDADMLATESLDETNRLSHLVESLMNLIQYGVHDQQHMIAVSDISRIIQKSIELLTPSAKIKGVAVNSQLKAVSMMIEPESIRKLATILLDNAIKYTPAGGSVSITLDKRNKSAVFIVADTGIGISKKDISHIFDRFYRTDTARDRTSSEGGYGLGLAIAKEIVSAHHGSIVATSTESKGTTMTVTLPLRM